MDNVVVVIVVEKTSKLRIESPLIIFLKRSVTIDGILIGLTLNWNDRVHTWVKFALLIDAFYIPELASDEYVLQDYLMGLFG